MASRRSQPPRQGSGRGAALGFVELLEGVLRGASSSLLPQLHQEWPLRDVSTDGMAECGELWIFWPHALLGWSFKEKGGEPRGRGGEEKIWRKRGLRGSSPSGGAAEEEQEPWTGL